MTDTVMSHVRQVMRKTLPPEVTSLRQTIMSAAESWANGDSYTEAWDEEDGDDDPEGSWKEDIFHALVTLQREAFAAGYEAAKREGESDGRGETS